MKLTFVTPRAGTDIVGGAEHAVRMLAKNCVTHGGVEAEILTTTAGDERTWSPRYEKGHEVIDGIDVYRFPNEPIDRTAFDAWAQPLLANPTEVTSALFDEWLIKQGPYSPELLSKIEECDSDAIIFHPMLSSPTSHGVFRAQRPVVLHPAFHDEPLSRMPGYREVARHADLIAFSTRYEQQLATELLDLNIQRQSVIGFGIDDAPDISSTVLSKVLSRYGLDSSTYAVVIGRVDSAKGADLCFDMFNGLYDSLHGVDKLVFVGPTSNSSNVVSNDRVIVAGIVDDETKSVLLSHARCLINPSVTESFSLVVLEAMSAGVPVVVNGRCGPTLEHVLRSNSGTYFTDAAEFVSAINFCGEESRVRNEMISRGKSYVKHFYDWENLINRYVDTLETVSSLATSS